MASGSALANPDVLNMTAFFMWAWSLLPTPFSNTLLRVYLYLRELPDRVLNQTTRTVTAIVHSFQNDAYWFYCVGSHYFAHHDKSSVMRVHKGKPQWLYTPHNTLFSWVAPITHADSEQTMRALVSAPVVYKRLPVIGATLYHRTATEVFEYDMSDWISGVRIMSPESSPTDIVPLLVLVLGWGLTHDICFEGNLSNMQIVMMSDTGEEKRFRVVTQEEIEEGEVEWSDDAIDAVDAVEQENEEEEHAQEESASDEESDAQSQQETQEQEQVQEETQVETTLSTDSDESPAPEHRRLPTHEEDT